jgi:hypothetical protein
MAADGSGIVLERSTSPDHIQHYAWDGSLTWDATMGTAGQLLAAPRGDRFLLQAGFTGDIRLYDDTGTELDAITGRSGAAEQYQWQSIDTVGNVGYLVGIRTSPPYVDATYYYRVLDATTDTLAWTSAEGSVTTDHANNTYYQWDVWEGQAVWGPADAAATGSIYWLDMNTGGTASGTRSSDTFYVTACGLYASVGFNDDVYSYTVWNSPVPPPVTSGFTYLRQRQSPVRAPSRVRGIDLRQRQTPIIT